jgi:HAE1 family hydrophobic/amphiphilic exporter-1
VRLSEVSVRRPVFALMLISGLVVLGFVSLGRLEMQLDPDVEFPFVYVRTELRGASPATVESEVTDVLEEQINTIEGVRTLRSTSFEGYSQIFIEFGLDDDVGQKIQEVRDQVALARPLLPIDVEEPLVQKYDMGAISIMSVMLGGPVSLRELSDLAEHEVSERLERIPGVGGVRIVGGREREIRIWLDPLRLTGYGLSIEDVADTLRSENAELGGGRIESASREWSVTTQGKMRNVEDFGALIVSQREGRVVRLRDVAVVEDGLADARSIARLDGEPGVALEVIRQSGANVVTLAREVRADVARIRETLPPGVRIHVSRDYATYIETQIHDVFVDMAVAAALVVVVVLIFLRDFRSTAIAALAIPASVIASFTFFYALGFSLNSLTLIALSLAIGLVIDDAIVVLESIYRRLEAGEAPMTAAEHGAAGVGLAVVSTTLAVCAVFVPIAFMHSAIGRYFYEFGLVVTVAVSVSTLIALTLTPMLASRWLRPQRRGGPVFHAFGRGLDATERAYRGLLATSLRHKGVTVAVALGAVVGGCGVASTLSVDFYRKDDVNEVAIALKMPIGTPLAVTNRTLRRMEEAIGDHPYVKSVFAVAGDSTRHEPNRARMEVMLVPKADRAHPIEETFEELRQRLAPVVADAENLSVSYPAYGGGDHTFSSLQYSLRGTDLARLERYANQLVARMEADRNFVDVESSFETGRPEISLEILRGRAADLGVPAVAVGRTIRALLAGEKVGSFEEGGRRHDVRVQVLPEFRDDPSKLDLIRVRSVRGELVPLTNAARMRVEEGPVEILRENGARMITISSNMAAGVPLGDGTRKLEAWADEIGIAPPDELAKGGSARAMQETADGLGFAFVLALAAIYMVLASLFNSLTHPFTIMMSAPLSFIGGFLALKISGMSMDMMSGIGLLVLMGLVMKNGILLVDYIEQLRAHGRSREEALLEAGPVRMRPVLMTSGALIFGLLPVVFSNSFGSEFRAPMAMITIGGLLTSTALTLVVVPVVYDLVDRATLGVQHTAGRLRALGVRRRHDAATREETTA